MQMKQQATARKPKPSSMSSRRLGAEQESAAIVQPGEGALDDPAVAARPRSRARSAVVRSAA